MRPGRVKERPGEVWPLPLMPRGVVKAALAACAVMRLLALAWLSSLALDAVLGRVSWSVVFVGAALVAAWLGWSVRALVAPGRGRNAKQDFECLCWQVPSPDDGKRDPDNAHMSPAGWTDSNGQEVRLKMVFDLGSLCLIRLHHPARPGSAVFRWIDAASLSGPWRWRLMMASSALSPSQIKPLSNSSNRSARRLA